MSETKVQTRPPAKRDASATRPAESKVNTKAVGPSILLIEDEDSLRSVVSRALSMDGYRVIEAANGREGVERFRRSFADLVITDIWMPDTDGLEATLQLTHDFPEIKIIAITGGSGDRDCLGVAKFFGARRTFKKPFDMKELLAAVRETLEEQVTIGRAGQKRRAYPRYAVRCASAFTGDEVRGVGKVLNISRGGCALESEVTVPRGSMVSIQIFLPQENSATIIERARVQWTTGFEFGLEFIRVPPKSQQSLQRFITRMQKEIDRQL